MSAHTQGPWKAVHRSITDQVDVEVAEISDMRVIRDIKGDSFSGTGSPDSDARLIAAAPDLLEALCALVLNHDAGGITRGALIDAKAAIAKATGETK